jgi:RNA polymerase sigma-70 factor (ECF subfamily)
LDDAKAFREFFDLMYPRFYRFAFYFLPESILCEELVSDVFMKIWNNRKHLPQIEKLDIYFLQAIKNQAFTYIKKKARSREYSSEVMQMPAVSLEQPDSLLIAGELAIRIEEAVSSLPPKCQAVFRLVRENGLTYKEAAAILEVSPRTVDNQMLIAMKRIRDIIQAFYQAKK